MAIIIVLNVVFAALVVGGILTLLGAGIGADRRTVRRLSPTQRVAQRIRRRRTAARSVAGALRQSA